MHQAAAENPKAGEMHLRAGSLFIKEFDDGHIASY